jgi:His/Glu/Gln/Arg/opine family amino acid ABC transporter permease subunit
MSLWPVRWTVQQRSTAALACAAVLLVLSLWAVAVPLSWAPDPIGPNAEAFAEGARMTMQLTLVAGAFGLGLGLLAALARRSPVWLWRRIAGFYIWVMRGTPLLVQVLFVYFALPELLPFLKLDDFSAACVALAFNVGAYNAEAIRAGLEAVPQARRAGTASGTSGCRWPRGRSRRAGSRPGSPPRGRSPALRSLACIGGVASSPRASSVRGTSAMRATMSCRVRSAIAHRPSWASKSP